MQQDDPLQPKDLKPKNKQFFSTQRLNFYTL